MRLTPLGPWLSRAGAAGWWLLPATVVGFLLSAILNALWATGNDALARAVWQWTAGAFRRRDRPAQPAGVR